MDTAEIRISAVAYREGDAWVMQAIEYDISAFSKSVDDLFEAFEQTVIDNIRVTEHLGRPPLDGIEPAPARFREMFENARAELRPIGHAVEHAMRHNVTARLADAA